MAGYSVKLLLFKESRVTLWLLWGMALAYAGNAMLMHYYQLPQLPWIYLPPGVIVVLAMGQVVVLAQALRVRRRAAGGRGEAGLMRERLHRPNGMATFWAGAASMPACVENECEPY
jgi:peptidoglycan/LPS O-acetylase OafA/YrhL